MSLWGGEAGTKKCKQFSTFSSDIVDWCTYLEDKIGHKVVNRFSKLPFQSLSISFSDSEGGQQGQNNLNKLASAIHCV